jgi:penicillin-binding protein 1A
MKKNDTIIFSDNNSARKKMILNLRGNVILAIIFLFAMTGSIVITAGSWFVFRLYQSLPSLNQMQNIEQSLVSRVLGKDGKPFDEFSIEKRFYVSLEKISPNLQNAVVAIEDRRFYKHWGVDLYRIFGAIFVNVVRGGYAQGASTLTQQLARNVYLTQKTSMIRKIREMLTAIQLESCYTKSEIMELYLNQVYLGAGLYGVEAASEYYFSKRASSLTITEAATIAGMIQTPEKYRIDKTANIGRITTRRNTVLRALRTNAYIDKDTYAALKDEPVKPNIKKQTIKVGAYFNEMVRKYVSEKYGDDALYHGGLTIHTTLDPVVEDSAERAVHEQILKLQARLNRIFLDSSKVDKKLKISRKFFLENFDSIYAAHDSEFSQLPDSHALRRAQASVIVIDVTTGAIRALIGGRNFQESKFNRALMAKRQPGSSFKPIVYTAAIEHGFTPASVILDQPITLLTPEGEWRPENYDHVFSGPLTIRNALARSVNLVAIQVLNKVGADTVIQYARKMGLNGDMAPVPSLAIGSFEATPMEMTAAYAILANKGIKATPYFIEKIVDKNGRVLETHTIEETEVLSSRTAFLMNSLMKTVVCCGTAASIPGLGFSRPAAGKTGTTNRYSDAWFIGYTPQLVCGVWTGVDERRSLGEGVTGSTSAIPIWVKTMIPAHKGLPVKDFEQPDSIKTEMLCSESHLVATAKCPKKVGEYFFEESIIDTCTMHGGGSKNNDGNIMKLFNNQQKTTKPADPKKKRLMF